MLGNAGLCQKCGKAHAHHAAKDQARGSDGWYQAEQTRLAWTAPARFPDGALGPLRNNLGDYNFNFYRKKWINGELRMKRKRDAEINFSWSGYFDYLQHCGDQVTDKGTLAVTNWSAGGARRDHNQIRADRLYLDCDNAGSWDQLRDFCNYFGLAAHFLESGSSVKRRDLAGDFNNQLRPDSWHAEFPLVYPILNPWASNLKAAPDDPMWDYFKNEYKRKYRHFVAVMSAFANLGGVGGNCGFDLTTSALCQMRFLGTRHGNSGTRPHMDTVRGNSALDFERFLALTGYQPAPLPTPRKAPKVITYPAAGGKVYTRQVAEGNSNLFADVKARIGVHEFLRLNLGRSPTSAAGGTSSYYFCPVHQEELNPSGLASGPNTQGFHVWTGPGGEERWKCHGNCKEELGEKDSGGDVIHLAARVWNVSSGRAAGKLAAIVGLNMDDYLTRANGAAAGPEVADPPPPSTLICLPLAREEDKREKKRSLRRFKTSMHTEAKPLYFVSDWVEHFLLPRPSLKDGIRALARYLMEGERNDEAKTIKILVLPEQVAATLYSVLAKRISYPAILGEVLTVYERLKNNKPAYGRGWIRDNLGPEGLLHIAGATWRDDMKNQTRHGRVYMDYVRKSLSFDLVIGEDRTFLYKILALIRAKMDTYVPGEDATKKEKLDLKKLLKRGKFLFNQTRRPIGCKRVGEDVTTNYGRDLGHRSLICQSRACTHCKMLEAMTVWEVAVEKWAKEGEIHFVQLELRNFDEVDVVKEYMRKKGRPRLTVIGVRHGKPVMTWASRAGRDASHVACHADLARNLLLDRASIEGSPEEEEEAIPLTREWIAKTPEEALGYILEQSLSFHTHARKFIFERDAEGWQEFMGWAHRRQVVVSRSKRALPWVTQEEIKQAARKGKEEEELLPGEVRIYDLVHEATGIHLSRQSRPHTIDQGMTMCSLKPEVKRANRRILASKKGRYVKGRSSVLRARARAPT